MSTTTQTMERAATGTELRTRRTSQSVTLQLPPNYPPFERSLDVRIPMHFSECRLKELKDPYDYEFSAYQELHCEVRTLFSGQNLGISLDVSPLSKPFRATFQYCVMKPQHRWQKMQDDVRFFAVSIMDSDIDRWNEVHSRLLSLIQKYFPDLADPPVRYFRLPNAVVGVMLDEDVDFEYDEDEDYVI